MRRYTETRDQSGELLRMVIPLMSAQQAGLHPASYATWYEYAAGINPPLKEALDRLLQARAVIDDVAVYVLYDRFVAGGGNDAESARLELQRLIDEIAGHAGRAGEQAQAYSTSLDKFSQTLHPDSDPQTLRAEVDRMIGQTRTMRSETAVLQEQMDRSSREIETLREELQRVRNEAYTDPLTGIANRRGFEHAVEQIRSANGGHLRGCSLLMLDIDHFKKCNDSYGHLFGDKVIRSVAQILVGNIKGRDLPARIGGEEFAVLLPETPPEGGCALAERIRTTVGAVRIKRGATGEAIGNITISIGVARSEGDEPIEALLCRADEALYAAKSGGRNRVILFDRPAAAAPRLAAPETAAAG